MYADGGGRELGYVAMSRARDRTTLHAVADDLPQAIEDLQTDWSHENRQRWITDTPAVTVGARQREPVVDVAAHHERLRQERAELEALTPPDPTRDLHQALHRISSLRDQLRDLPYDTGHWRGTDIGQAAREKLEASRQHHQAKGFANSGGSIRTRHFWRKTARAWATAEIEATQRYEELAAPIRERLEGDLHAAEVHVDHLEGQASTRDQWLDTHPELQHRLAAIDRELDPTPTIQQRLDALQAQRPSRDLGIGLEL